MGGPTEKKYLQETYDCQVFNVPPFLDTCRDDINTPAVCKGVEFYQDGLGLKKQVCKRVIEWKRTAPMLVICATTKEAKEMHATIMSYLRRKGADPKRLQLFLEKEEDGTARDPSATQIM